MPGKFSIAPVLIGLTLAAAGLAQLPPAMVVPANAAGLRTQMDMSGSPDQATPSYHAYAPMPPIPATLDPSQFPDALNRNVYAMAGKIRPVLYQQPCYCYCDRHIGHKSLLDCFAGTHGSECDICQKEAIFAYRMTQKKKTSAQIRAAIIRGDWKSADLVPFLAGPAPR
jgi:hypothetical protein